MVYYKMYIWTLLKLDLTVITTKFNSGIIYEYFLDLYLLLN